MNSVLVLWVALFAMALLMFRMMLLINQLQCKVDKLNEDINVLYQVEGKDRIHAKGSSDRQC
jgi:hypothetical protein